MNPEKAEKLFALMHKYGVELFKNDELEIKMGSIAVKAEPKELKVPAKTSKPSNKNIPSQAAPPVEIEIPHHVNEVQNLLRLKDEDLVDKLFPDYSQPPKQGIS